jgi:MraZ protein
VFRGNHPAKVDEKGRLKLPSAFKALVDAASVTQFYVTSVDGESAQVWPLPEWEKREAELGRLSALQPVLKKYLAVTSYYGQQVEMDGQGRILVPQILRTRAGLDDEEAVVLGMGEYLELHNRKRFEAKAEANKLTDEDLQQLAQLLGGKV